MKGAVRNQPERKVVSQSLGCHVEGHVLPKPDLDAEENVAAAAQHRFACKMKRPGRKLLRRLRRFTHAFCRRFLRPLAHDTDTSFETWLESTSYNRRQKLQLRDLWDKTCGGEEYLWVAALARCSSFLKDEHYELFKHARAINSPHPTAKVFLGPLFKAIEDQVYRLRWFVKHKTPRERADILAAMERPGWQYLETDYTSFEAAIQAEIIRCVEAVVYRYMWRYVLPEVIIHQIVRRLAGLNVCKFRTITVTVPGRRMSGQMNTSLGNGLVNLVVMLFCCECNGLTWWEVVGCVEGDDGFFVFPRRIDLGVLADLGFVIKAAWYATAWEASFCQLHLVGGVLLVHPAETLCRFGWTKRSWVGMRPARLRMLLRAKAISLLAEAQGCPVLQEFALMVMRHTQGVRMSPEFLKTHLSRWEYDELERSQGAKASPVPLECRLAYEDLFNVPIRYQEVIEAEFKDKPYGVLRHPLILDLMRPEWAQAWELYTKPVAATGS